ncbi:MAG: DUF501 domain-containing protein [Actinomycetota bacterium]
MSSKTPDSAAVELQLGRPPRGDISVVARCHLGLPLVIRTPSKLDDGTPFPTLYYLTCPVAVRCIGVLESTGEMRALNERLRSDDELSESYRRAHERYRIDRDGSLDGRTDSAGGMPARIKCLHALYAHEVADSNPIGAIVRERIEPLPCANVCVETSSDGSLRRVAGHPGFRKK